MNMMALMYVALGGAVGSMARYALMSLVGHYSHGPFPFGTFAVNILGGFVMGAWIAVMALWLPPRARDLHLLFAVGVLGGFTTFSTFSVDVFMLLEGSLWGQAAVYIIGSVALSVGALVAGMWAVHRLLG